MNKRMFWLVWGVALVPMVSAMVMYYGGLAVPQGRVNHGELVVGQQLSGWFEMRNAPETLNTDHWQLILTSSAPCLTAQPCAEWQQRLEKIHVALGKDSDRVVVNVFDSATASGQGEQSDSPGEAIWIADPMGNLVLRYEFEQSPRGVLDDLRKLLKLSKVG